MSESFASDSFASGLLYSFFSWSLGQEVPKKQMEEAEEPWRRNKKHEETWHVHSSAIGQSKNMMKWPGCRLWPPSSCQEPQLQSLLHHVQMPQNVPPIPKAVQSEVSIWPAICVRCRVLAVCSKMSQVFFLCAQESPKRKAAKKENFAGHATDVHQRNLSSNTKDTHVTLTHPHGVPWYTVSFRWPLLVVIHWCFAWHSHY